MDREALARLLIEADAAERSAHLRRHADLADAGLAWALKAVYDDARAKDPLAAAAAAAALTSLADTRDDADIRALQAWTAGRAALQIEGKPAQGLVLLDDAIAAWEALNAPHHAAAVQVARLHALALLGQYDEAITSGLHARDVLLAHGDLISAGTIEQNIGNLYHRRDQYIEAERFLRQAYARYRAVGNDALLAQAGNGIAIELMYQHRFGEAAAMYAEALTHAQRAGLELTEAEIEVNLGNLSLFQGRYDRALDYLERARRRYATLDLPHELATVELELADAYLELNLVPEAATLYERIIPTFASLEMRAEQARALAYYGWAAAQLDQIDEAYAVLAKATALYEAEHNTVGAATATTFAAQIHYVHHDYANARDAAVRAQAAFADANAWARLLFARWLHGDIERILGHHSAAKQILETTLRDAEAHIAPQVVYRCQTSLGLLAAAHGDIARAETAFRRAMTLVEELRAPLPAEEFHMAFTADKLVPFAELVRLCLDHGTRITQALRYVERARSRALADILGGALTGRTRPRDAFEADLLAKLDAQREELNWLYNQMGQRDGTESASTTVDLQASIHERERAIQEINRQLQQRTAEPEPAQANAPNLDDIEYLQRSIGTDTVIVEYFALDGELMAFVLDHAGVQVMRGLGKEPAVETLVEQLRFQIDAMRFGSADIRKHLDILSRRALHYLRALYDILLKPLAPRLADRRLVVIPYRSLHYVPFHALHDGSRFVIEEREVSYAPSATVLRHCLDRPVPPFDTALLLGVADPQTPQVHHEIAAITPLFRDTITLLDADATRSALFANAPRADVLHLACHGQFRPDNPLFSSLRLGDGWLTVYDAYGLETACGLVTLSACETGASAIAPGDEILGLARAFFSIGAPSLVVSLWTADDASTATLMRSFYDRLRAGDRPASALRRAQRALLAEQPHPFFWSPFVLLGRW